MQQNALIQTQRNQLKQVIVGWEYLLDRLILALLAHGHILVEGAPGLAKTTAIKVLTAALDSMWYRENKPELEEIKQAANRCRSRQGA